MKERERERKRWGDEETGRQGDKENGTKGEGRGTVDFVRPLLRGLTDGLVKRTGRQGDEETGR